MRLYCYSNSNLINEETDGHSTLFIGNGYTCYYRKNKNNIPVDLVRLLRWEHNIISNKYYL